MELWYSEQEAELIRTSFNVEKVLFSGKSEFQTLDVVETKPYGTMLLLDGLVMITDVDEFVYHEMISHIPVCLHANPKKVVVIGGGDGGTVRELLKYPSIEEIILCEIDGLVIEKSKEFFPEVACGLDDKRVKVHVADGVAFMQTLKNSVDIVLVDSTDPIGPGEGLFSRAFYKSVADSLRTNGLMAAQSECPWFKREVFSRIMSNIRGGFAHHKTYVASIPTYPRGFWSWTIGSQKPIDPQSFDRNKFKIVSAGLNYLTEELMTAAFAIPKFLKDKVYE